MLNPYNVFMLLSFIIAIGLVVFGFIIPFKPMIIVGVICIVFVGCILLHDIHWRDND